VKSIESIDKTAKSIGVFDSINYGVYPLCSIVISRMLCVTRRVRLGQQCQTSADLSCMTTTFLQTVFFPKFPGFGPRSRELGVSQISLCTWINSLTTHWYRQRQLLYRLLIFNFLPGSDLRCAYWLLTIITSLTLLFVKMLRIKLRFLANCLDIDRKYWVIRTLLF